MENWEFFKQVNIIYGCGSRIFLIDKIKNYTKVLIVTTKRGRKFIENDFFLSQIIKNVEWIDSITPNPSLKGIQEKVDKLSIKGIKAVIAFGGGSCIDSAKVISATFNRNDGSRNIIELINNPQRYLTKYSLPIFAIPTTSGTGSEVTPYATLWDTLKKKKISLQHRILYPKFAIVDPELTYNLPSEITFSSGLDCLNQAFESIWNRNRNSLSIKTASKSIKNALIALPRLNKDLQDIEARKLISEASVLSGISISQTRTAICHSISYPITSNFGVKHGFACAFTMYSIARKVNEYQSECFFDVVQELNLNSSEELIAKIKDILEILSVKDHVKKSIKNKKEVFLLIDKMITPGRSDNFILPVDKNFIAKTLEESL